jgi:mRNA interferase MazF
MEIRRGHLYIVDFNPRVRTKPGKLRPALVIQADPVNEAGYPSTIVIPTTTKLVEDPGLLRLRLRKGQGGLERDSDLLMGQLIAVANESFVREIGILAENIMEEMDRRVRIILFLP